MPAPEATSPRESPQPPLTVAVKASDLPAESTNGQHVQTLTLCAIGRHVPEGGDETVVLHTDRGDVVARYHPSEPGPGCQRRAVLWVAGAGGGMDGPAGGLYPATCAALQQRGIAGLRVQYRHPNRLAECILDARLGVTFLRLQTMDRVAIVGHSFGGAVAIAAGALAREVTAVVAMSTQTYGAHLASRIAPRPLLLIHGTADEVLPPVCSELVYAAAHDPRELKLFAGASHGLDGVRDDLVELLAGWLEKRA